MNKKLSFKGFTLVELLMVIVMLALIVSMLIIAINPSVQFQKAHDTQRKNDLTEIKKALELYYEDNGSYPTGDISNNYTIENITWGDPWSTYMAKLPADQDSSQRYVYYSDGQIFRLYAHLERGANDPQVCNSGLVCSNVPINIECGSGKVCNYGVTSTDTTP